MVAQRLLQRMPEVLMVLMFDTRVPARDKARLCEGMMSIALEWMTVK